MLVCVSLALCLLVFVPITTAQPKPQYGGTLKLCFSNDALILGWPPEMRTTNELTMVKASLETLARYDKNGKHVPHLAEKWMINANAKTVTISLRKGIKFHDGTDFNAKSCKWNLDNYRMTSNRPELKDVASIDIVDDYTVRLNLSRWANDILEMMVSPSGYMISPTAYEKNGKEWCQKHPVGTGPFKLVSWERDVKQVYEKFDGYWQKGKPYLDRIEIIVIADPMVQTVSFLRGEVDILVWPTTKDAKDLMQKGNYNIVSMKTGMEALQTGILGDSGHPDSPFADVRVRQAISYALDKQALNEIVFKGMGVLTSQWGAPGNWSYNPKVVGFPYNPAKAKELLSKAGYPNGFKTKIYCENTAIFYNIVEYATAIQGYLSKVGIDMAVEPVGTPLFVNMTMQTGWSNSLVIWHTKTEPDIVRQMLRGTHSSGIMYTKSIIHPKQTDELIEKALSVSDWDTKVATTHELQRLIFEELAIYTPICVTPTLAAKYPKVHDDSLAEISLPQWTPENAWKEK